MKEMVKVSLIVPVYNTGKYLSRCVESILTQSESAIELLLIDDGSTDNSKKIIEEYCDSDHRIRGIFKEHSGMSSSRNLGIELALGEYVIFIDSDDWIDQNMISDMYKVAYKYDSDYVRCNYVKEMNNRKIYFKPLFEKEKHIDKSEFKNRIYPNFINSYTLNSTCISLIKRNVLLENYIRFNSKYRYGEDFLFNLELFTVLKNAAFIPNSYYHYFYNNNSITTTKDIDVLKEKIICAYKVYSQLYTYLKKWKLDKKYRDSVNFRINSEIFSSIKILFYLNSTILFKDKLSILNDVYSYIIQSELQISKHKFFLNLYKKRKFKSFLMLGQILYGIPRFFKDGLKSILLRKKDKG